MWGSADGQVVLHTVRGPVGGSAGDHVVLQTVSWLCIRSYGSACGSADGQVVLQTVRGL